MYSPPDVQGSLLVPSFSPAFPYIFNLQGQARVVERPQMMGILNLTPDSFYSNSRQPTVDHALRTAEAMLNEGADLLDIGGASTRPGATALSSDEEMARVIPALTAIAQRFPQAWLSIDTYHATVASAAVQAGARVVNDVSGGLFDEAMLPTVARLKVPYIAMHMQGTPAIMQQNPQYENVLAEVTEHLARRAHACTLAGIPDVILDPGFGFGKTQTHNYELLAGLPLMHTLRRPVLVGVSRKGMAHKVAGVSAADSLPATTALHAYALERGAMFLRVHDVAPAVQARAIWQQLQAIQHGV